VKLWGEKARCGRCGGGGSEQRRSKKGLKTSETPPVGESGPALNGGEVGLHIIIKETGGRRHGVGGTTEFGQTQKKKLRRER